jgi:mRNA interferase HigB
MRVLDKRALVEFWTQNPDSRIALERWHDLAKKADWKMPDEVRRAFSNATVLNGERICFKIAGNKYRLIVAFHFRSQLAVVKFIGTHAEYDKIDALRVSEF